MMKKPRNSDTPKEVRIKKVVGLSPMTKAFTFELCDKKLEKEFSFEPGQFLMFSVLGYGESVLTITSTKKDLPELEVAVRSVGNNTQAIHRLKVGDLAWIRGPYGNFFELDKMAGREVVIIAGGIGLAPLRSLARTTENDPKIVGRLKILVGAKTPEDFIFKADLAKWQSFADVFLSCDKTDADWTGHVGKVTELLDKIKVSSDAIAVLCGPPVMFGPTIEKLKESKLKDENIYIMLERLMQCGMGKCQHCTCGEKYVCLDGPTFTWAELKDNWEALK